VKSQQKRGYLLSLCEGWHPRENQTTIGDCYNLALLAGRSGDIDETLFWTDQGLRRDRNNQRLREIQDRARATMHGRTR